VGCQSVDSTSVFTDGIYADVSATATGDGTTLVRTTLYLESPSTLNYIEIEGDDILSVYGPMGEEKTMRESDFLNMTSYSATFNIDTENSEFIVGLSRIIDVSAPNSRVSLPAPFEIDTIAVAEFSRATQNIVITWDGADSSDDMDYSIDGTCIDYVFGVIEVDPITGNDPGVLSVPGTDIQVAQGEPADATCPVTLTLTRSREGMIDENYGHGGDAFAYQTRAFSFTTIE
jgi:hypothetical protein